eukprot:m.393654 g.393654  ORF g.393654 m.393654 type:complete len:1125 (+) comp56357_c0_seq7:539-3913(+)
MSFPPLFPLLHLSFSPSACFHCFRRKEEMLGRSAAALLLLVLLCAVSTHAVTREYFIQAETFLWDYAPSRIENPCYGGAYTTDQAFFVTNSDGHIGSVYKKARFFHYTTSQFTAKRPRPQKEQHLGFLSDVIRVAVGDMLVVTIRNTLDFNINFTPGSLVVGGNRGTAGNTTVEPGATRKFTWTVPVAAGPGPNDLSSVLVFYRSTYNLIADTYTGLLGPLVIYRKGALYQNTPVGIDNELFNFLWVGDENRNHYLEENIAAHLPGDWEAPEDFGESNLMHHMNGFLYCNNPHSYIAVVGQRTRWYTGTVGTTMDIHTPHWHGNTLRIGARFNDIFEIVPGSTVVADMIPDAANVWLFHCHVNAHISAGMVTVYHVTGTDIFGPPETKIREYFLQAETVEWNYAPSGNNLCGATPRPFEGIELSNTEHIDPQDAASPRDARIGTTYLKAKYVAYTDATFSTVRTTGEEAELGILGPVMRAEVGDLISVTFKNTLDFPITVHPHGVHYLKDSEGAPYEDGVASGVKMGNDMVMPGQTVVQHWHVPERAGPAEAQGSSVMWLYHSHFDEIADTLAGLVGYIIVIRKGMADARMKPKDVDKEVFTLFQIFNEAGSLFFEDNLHRLFGSEIPEGVEEDKAFLEANMKPSINGYMYCNLPVIALQTCKRVRWYVSALGSENDMHTVSWDGQVVNEPPSTHNADTLLLLAASMRSVDHVPVKFNTSWIFQANADDLSLLGETAKVTVSRGPSSACLPPSTQANPKRTFYIAAEKVAWNYIPTGLDLCGDEADFDSALQPWGRYFSDVGSESFKDTFVLYTDATFSTRASKPLHEGLLGPTLRMEVGDNVTVVLRNKLSRSVNIHPRGVYFDRDDLIPPGSTRSFRWNPTAKSGPINGTSQTWLYHTSNNSPLMNRGSLFGAIIVYAKGMLKAAAVAEPERAKDVQKEFVLAFYTIQEQFMPYAEIFDGDGDEDAVSLLETRFTINGYSFCNLPGLVGSVNDTVRLHFLSIGALANTHGVYFQGHAFDVDGVSSAQVAVLPGITVSADVRLAQRGSFLISTESVDTGVYGARALFTTVRRKANAACLYDEKDVRACAASCVAAGLQFDRFVTLDYAQPAVPSCSCSCKPAV